MNPNAHVIGIMAVAISLLMVPITVHAPTHPIFQDGSVQIPPPLFDHEKFLIDQNSAIRDIAPALTFNERLQFFIEDVGELFTFNPVAKAQLKLEHAQERQQAIDQLDSRGLAIPFEFEERRIQKLDEANVILTDSVVDRAIIEDNNRITDVITLFNTLRQMGELNDIRVLYSQIPSVIDASPEIKAEFNAKVNSLVSWQENCVGEFDIDSLLPLSTTIDKLENQCPKLVELQEQFGRERLRLLVTGQI